MSIEWNGVGLPPAGTVCEIRIVIDKVPPYAMENMIQLGINPAQKTWPWERATILYMGSRYAVVDRRGELNMPLTCVEFRRLLTPEQIAAEKREKAVDEMCRGVSLLNQVYGMREFAEKLYDAGYRK